MKMIVNGKKVILNICLRVILKILLCTQWKCPWPDRISPVLLMNYEVFWVRRCPIFRHPISGYQLSHQVSRGHPTTPAGSQTQALMFISNPKQFLSGCAQACSFIRAEEQRWRKTSGAEHWNAQHHWLLIGEEEKERRTWECRGECVREEKGG